MGAQITLSRTTLAEAQAEQHGVFDMKITATGVSGTDEIDVNIFLYQRETIDEAENVKGDTCVGLCSLSDMSEYPIGSPAGTGYGFFRKDYTDNRYRTRSEANAIWEFIQKEVIALCKAIDAIEDASLHEVEEVVINATSAVSSLD